MSKTKSLLIIFIFGLVVSLVFPTVENEVYAGTKNEVTLNFVNGIIHDGYVEYSNIGKLQLFKGDELIVNISNNMTIDLNEADYKLVIQEIPAEDTGSVVGPAPVKLNINGWYYPMTTIVGESKTTFKLESNKFSGTLDIKLVRNRTVVNTRVENTYTDISSKGIIDLTNGKEYVIDFSKTDELTEGLKSFADLDKTLYYKRDNESLLVTDNESEAVIKIVGNMSANKAILTAVNVETKKSEVFKGFHTKYTGSKLQYDGSVDNIINETRTDYYTRCTYEFTFQYIKEEVIPKEYKFTEGANQTYTIDQNTEARFRINADYSLFDKKVYVDDILVDGANYTSESGSTIITFSKEYIDTLAIGQHTLKVAFTDGGEAKTTFTIARQFEENNNNENVSLNTGNKKEMKDNGSNPKTGDNVMLYIAIVSMSIIGLGATTVAVKKDKTN